MNELPQDDDLFDLDFTAPGAIDKTYTGIEEQVERATAPPPPAAPPAAAAPIAAPAPAAPPPPPAAPISLFQSSPAAPAAPTAPPPPPAAPAGLSLAPLEALATAAATPVPDLAPAVPKPVVGDAAQAADRFAPLDFEPVKTLVFSPENKPQLAPAAPATPAPAPASPAAQAKPLAPAPAASASPAPAPAALVAPAAPAPSKPKDALTAAALAAAEGRPEEAIKWLSGKIPAAKEEFAWRMLFELDQRLGRRDLFEQRAIAFAARLEKSPPAWVDPQGITESQTDKGAAASISFSGNLYARAAEPLRRLVEVAQQRDHVKLELSRLVDLDEEGSQLLLDALRKLKTMGKTCAIQGVSHAIELAKSKLKLGQAEKESIWLLALELLQRAHRAEQFDDWAVNYAVTFEVSPPAYEPPADNSTAEEDAVRTSPTSTEFPLVGDWIKETEAGFETLEALVRGDARISALDAAELGRIDLTSARALARVLERLKGEGHPLTIKNSGYLHLPLLLLAGLPEGDIELRKQ